MCRVSALLIALVATGAPVVAGAQPSLAERVRGTGTRTVAFTTRTRAEACGDGRTSFSDGLIGSRSRIYTNDRVYYGTDWMILTHAGWDSRIPPCEHGPMRVLVRVVDGSPSWVRAAVGPATAFPALADTITDLGTVGSSEAGTFLREVVRGSQGRAATDAMEPLVLVDSAPRWETLAAAAGDTTRLVRYRRRAADILARAAAATLGPVPVEDDSPRANERREAVNAFARRRDPADDPVPQLLALARQNPHLEARVAALYQLGQTGDPRAVPLFASMLGVRVP
jgi:hypothetical protein